MISGDPPSEEGSSEFSRVKKQYRRLPQSGPVEIDFHKIFHLIWGGRKILFTTTGIALLLAALYLWKTPKAYVSQTIVQVQQPTSGLGTTQESGRDDVNAIESLKTIEQNLNSLSLMRRIVVSPKLGLTPEMVGLTPRPESPYEIDELAIALAPHLNAQLQRGTRLIAITAVHGNPVMAKKLAETVVIEYKARLNDDQKAAAEEVNRILLDEAARQKVKLEDSEKALQAYKETTQSVSLEDTQNIIVEQLKELNNRYAEAQAERLRLESVFGVLTKLTDRTGEKLLGIPIIGADPAVLDQKKALADLQAEFANLRERYLPKHPRYIQVEGQLQQLKEGVNEAALGAADRVETLYLTAKASEEKFGLSLQEQEKKALELNQKAIGYNVLKREVESNTALFDAVLKRLKEADASKGFEQDNIRLVDAPSLPNDPARPRKKIIVFGALLAGLFLGLSIILIKQLFNTSLNTVDEAEQSLQLPILAAIPTSIVKDRAKNAFTMIEDSGGLVAEGFRSLRTALAISNDDTSDVVTLFTSALPGEGKTFCSVNYAISLAQQGYNTLLIDADLRLPSLNKLFFQDQNHPGLSDCILKNSLSLTACLKTDISNLKVLTAGTKLRNASELLSSPELREILSSAANTFDRVVIDSAPVNAVSDALLLANLVSTICLVVGAGQTPQKASRHAIRMLTETGHPPVGFILNRVATSSGRGFYYHYGTGSYGNSAYSKATTPEEVK